MATVASRVARKRVSTTKPTIDVPNEVFPQILKCCQVKSELSHFATAHCSAISFPQPPLIQRLPIAIEPSCHPFKRQPYKTVVLRGQPLEGVPVHPFRFPTAAVKDAWLPPQPIADSVGFPRCPVIPGFPLAGVGQPVAVPAGEDAAAVKDRYAPTASSGRAEEPGTLAANMASGPVEIDWIAFIIPALAAAAVAVGEDHPVRFCAHLDGRNHLIMP